MKLKGNDIPEYLKGKNAVQIVAEVTNRFARDNGKKSIFTGEGDLTSCIDDYIKHLEMVLVLAVGDALCNCDRSMRVNELVAGNTDGPGDRAIAFLNMVLPKE